MKKYKVISIHDIHEDYYTEGQGKLIASFNLNSEQNANSPVEAIEKHFNSFGYKFEDKLAQFDVNVCHYGFMVDEDNAEASTQELEQFKNGSKKLYADNTTIQIYEMNLVIFN